MGETSEFVLYNVISDQLEVVDSALFILRIIMELEDLSMYVIVGEF